MLSRSKSVILNIFVPECTLAAGHAACWWVTVSMPTGQTGRRRTPDRYITLFAMDATSAMMQLIVSIRATWLGSNNMTLDKWDSLTSIDSSKHRNNDNIVNDDDDDNSTQNVCCLLKVTVHRNSSNIAETMQASEPISLSTTFQAVSLLIMERFK